MVGRSHNALLRRLYYYSPLVAGASDHLIRVYMTALNKHASAMGSNRGLTTSPHSIQELSNAPLSRTVYYQTLPDASSILSRIANERFSSHNKTCLLRSAPCRAKRHCRILKSRYTDGEIGSTSINACQVHQSLRIFQIVVALVLNLIMADLLSC